METEDSESLVRCIPNYIHRCDVVFYTWGVLRISTTSGCSALSLLQWAVINSKCLPGRMEKDPYESMLYRILVTYSIW